MSNDTDVHAASNAQVEAISNALSRGLLALHNEGFASGTERESYSTPPIWMQRKANHLTVDVVAALDEVPA